MKRSLLRLFCLGAIAGAMTLQTACEVGYYDDGGVVEASLEPPPPRYEVVPVAPYPGAVWIGGSWMWRHGRHEWVDGRYVRPRPGYTYVPHHWDRQPNGRWRRTPGRWHH